MIDTMLPSIVTQNYSDKYINLNEVLFASDWEHERTQAFMNHWVHTCVKLTAVYLFVVFFGQKLMKSLPALDGAWMDYTLAAWNFLFSVFSGFAAYRLVPELF